MRENSSACPREETMVQKNLRLKKEMIKRSISAILWIFNLDLDTCLGKYTYGRMIDNNKSWKSVSKIKLLHIGSQKPK